MTAANHDPGFTSSISSLKTKCRPPTDPGYKNTHTPGLHTILHIHTRITACRHTNDAHNAVPSVCMCMTLHALALTHTFSWAHHTNAFHFIPWITGVSLKIYFPSGFQHSDLILYSYSFFLCSHSDCLFIYFFSLWENSQRPHVKPADPLWLIL